MSELTNDFLFLSFSHPDLLLSNLTPPGYNMQGPRHFWGWAGGLGLRRVMRVSLPKGPPPESRSPTELPAFPPVFLLARDWTRFHIHPSR